jgi:outer membrane biosynthesis protein TonB
MTKKTRIRVARIAAGAVIAAGASLTAAGAASALDFSVGANAGDDGVKVDVAVGTDDPTTPPATGIPTDTPPTSEPPTTEPPTTEPPTSEPPTTEPPTSEPPTTSEPTDPSQPTDEPTEPTDDPTGGMGNGGGDNTNPDGGNSPVQQGKGSSGLTDTSAQGKDGKQLAETGAGQTAFLLVGAATMIAGGIGFRVLPRLVNGRGGAAA